MKARLITEIGTRIWLRVYWDGKCNTGSYHNAIKFVMDMKACVEFGPHRKKISDYSEWPIRYSDCQEIVPETANKQVFSERLYNTQSGKPEPGDLYFTTWLPENYYWDNHKGPMLMAVCPSGDEWNIDSRASNCGLPDDRLHRCWVRHGEPPLLTVDKNGLTCNAGAGSI